MQKQKQTYHEQKGMKLKATFYYYHPILSMQSWSKLDLVADVIAKPHQSNLTARCQNTYSVVVCDALNLNCGFHDFAALEEELPAWLQAVCPLWRSNKREHRTEAVVTHIIVEQSACDRCSLANAEPANEFTPPQWVIAMPWCHGEVHNEMTQMKGFTARSERLVYLFSLLIPYCKSSCSICSTQWRDHNNPVNELLSLVTALSSSCHCPI